MAVQKAKDFFGVIPDYLYTCSNQPNQCREIMNLQRKKSDEKEYLFSSSKSCELKCNKHGQEYKVKEEDHLLYVPEGKRITRSELEGIYQLMKQLKWNVMVNGPFAYPGHRYYNKNNFVDNQYYRDFWGAEFEPADLVNVIKLLEVVSYTTGLIYIALQVAMMPRPIKMTSAYSFCRNWQPNAIMHVMNSIYQDKSNTLLKIIAPMVSDLPWFKQYFITNYIAWEFVEILLYHYPEIMKPYVKQILNKIHYKNIFIDAPYKPKLDLVYRPVNNILLLMNLPPIPGWIRGDNPTKPVIDFSRGGCLGALQTPSCGAIPAKPSAHLLLAGVRYDM